MITSGQISEAVTDHGWRLVLGTLSAAVPVESLAEATGIAARAVAEAGRDADGLLTVDLRPDHVLLHVRPASAERSIALARRLAMALPDLTADPGRRTVHRLELAIDALDIPAVRPFWKAVLGYVDAPGESPVTGAVVDPYGQDPPVWFQQMDAPRPQRNRIHLDVSVPHDAAPARIDAALAAGGVLRSDDAAPAFWVLADAEGNEACITTWQGRN